MKLSRAVEQACCIMALLASPHAKNPVTNEALTRVMETSPTYMKKITRKLVVSGLIASASGANGGFVLGRAMNRITLKDVVDAVDGQDSFFQPQGLIERVFANKQRKVELGMNMIEEVFMNAQSSWNEALSKVTLEDIAKEVIYE